MRRQVTLLHNPRCSKSREALRLLEAEDIALTVRRYLDEPLGADELRALVALLGPESQEWVRAKDAVKHHIELPARSDIDGRITLVAQQPALLERPIALCGKRAIIGRPAARVLEVL